MKSIPKIIWIYWHQGWENAPWVVTQCCTSWSSLNPGWEVRLLTRDNLDNYIRLENEIPGFAGKDISLPALSDLIRICLLKAYGGVWADSTLLCRVPLDQWLENYSREGFFAFARPAADRMISSWFLAATVGNPIVQTWYERAAAYWKERTSTEDYFWFHHLFNKIFFEEETVKKSWEKVPELLAAGPHYFIPYTKKLFERVTLLKVQEIEKVSAPVFKLTHKYDQDTNPSGTVLEYLLNIPGKQKNKRILVAWYGSFDKNGTLGDYLSVKVLVSFLEEKGYDYDIACYKDFPGLGPKQCRLDESFLRPYRIILFCCGPILKNHQMLSSLFQCFGHLYKIGVGVSLLPEGHFNHYNPFDFLLARENSVPIYEDLAILAQPSARMDKKRKGRLRVGIALRGKQMEYGTENCMHEQAGTLLNGLAVKIGLKYAHPLDKLYHHIIRKDLVIHIDHHLETSGLDPEEIDEQYLHCGLVLTTRFHGAVMAFRHGIPCIAIDQIRGGAKVSRLLEHMSYPFYWKIEEARMEDILILAEELIEGHHIKIIKEIREKAILRANDTLMTLDRHLSIILNEG
jgi:hypothetical protein